MTQSYCYLLHLNCQDVYYVVIRVKVVYLYESCVMQAQWNHIFLLLPTLPIPTMSFMNKFDYSSLSAAHTNLNHRIPLISCHKKCQLYKAWSDQVDRKSDQTVVGRRVADQEEAWAGQAHQRQGALTSSSQFLASSVPAWPPA